MSSRDPGGDAVPPSPGGLGIAPNIELSVVGVLYLCSSPGISGFEQTNRTKGLYDASEAASPDISPRQGWNGLFGSSHRPDS